MAPRLIRDLVGIGMSRKVVKKIYTSTQERLLTYLLELELASGDVRL